ncbi:hypothetical protein ACFQ2B_09820 [Streptomyces stramineus]
MSRSEGVVRNAEILGAIGELPSHHFSAVHVRNGDRLTVTKDLLNTMALGFVVLVHDDPARLQADHDTVRRLEGELILVP